MNQFTERYKSASNTQLLEIINKQSDYQALAVEAAKLELDSRKLTATELNSATEELYRTEQVSKQNDKKTQAQIDKVKNVAKNAFDTLNPIQENALNTGKIINLITIVFGGIAIYHFAIEFGLIKFMLTNETDWDLSMILYIMPMILLPIASVLFWFRKKIGWVLLGIYLVNSAVNILALTIMSWNIEPLGNDALDSFFPTSSPIFYLVTSAFYIGFLWVISKPDLRLVFSIDKKTMIKSIAITAIFSTLIHLT